MIPSFLLKVTLFSSLATSALAKLSDGRPHANFMKRAIVPKIVLDSNLRAKPVVDQNGAEIPPYDTVYEFDQLIDHKNPSLGTFKQRYWHTYEFYKPGGPIILMTPGEGNADGYFGYLTNRSISGAIAQQQSGSAIVLEHRFYGFSNPYPDLSVRSLKLHTLQQAIDDLEYFAKNAKLPQPDGDNVGPDKNPWILVGGSYSGALTSWTMVNKPGLFFAGYASSGVVEAILDYWRYFEPIRQHMPANCSADVGKVIAHIDKTFTGKNKTAINELKARFGMEEVTHLDDVAGTLRNNLWDWQALSPSSGPNAQFFQFCDALEVKDGVNAPAAGLGLDHALEAWSSYFKNEYLPGICGDSNREECLGSYDPTQIWWTDTSIDNAWRSWFWIVCNEVGYLQNGPPKSHPAIVTRLTDVSYDLRQCTYMFPEAHLKPFQTTAGILHTNIVYKGWNVREKRLFFANGEQDPWRDATVSAETVHVPSTANQPIYKSNGFHCSDMSIRNGVADPTVGAVQTAALAAMKEWLKDWKPRKPTHSKRDEEKVVKPLNAWLKKFPVIEA